MKILLCWDKSEKVQTFVLNIDASEGTLEGCTESIKHSMKKINNMIALLLQGQTIDCGGVGVLDSLAKQLKKRDLCTPTFLVAFCMLHARQIVSVNPVKKAMGKSSLGAQTMMPMFHSAYDLQESMEFSEFRFGMEEVKLYIKQKQSDCLPPYRYDCKIKISWSTLGTGSMSLPCLTESDESPHKIQKIPQPVLTRW
jgi:hypothetical protein